MYRKAKSMVLAAVIAAILFVLISPLPEMDATALRRVVVIAVTPVVIAQVAIVLLAGVQERPEPGTAINVPDLLAILCIRHC